MFNQAIEATKERIAQLEAQLNKERQLLSLQILKRNKFMALKEEFLEYGQELVNHGLFSQDELSNELNLVSSTLPVTVNEPEEMPVVPAAEIINEPVAEPCTGATPNVKLEPMVPAEFFAEVRDYKDRLDELITDEDRVVNYDPADAPSALFQNMELFRVKQRKLVEYLQQAEAKAKK